MYKCGGRKEGKPLLGMLGIRKQESKKLRKEASRTLEAKIKLGEFMQPRMLDSNQSKSKYETNKLGKLNARIHAAK